MSYIVLRQNRGNWYKYQVESIWQDGQTRKRQTYLGRATEEEIRAWCQARGLDPGPGIQRKNLAPRGIRISKGLGKALRKALVSPEAEKRPSLKQDQESRQEQASGGSEEVLQDGEPKSITKEGRGQELRLYVMNTQGKPHLDFLREWALPRFDKKFGQPADTVFCHPKDFPSLHPNGLGIKTLKSQYVQRNCFQLTRRG